MMKDTVLNVAAPCELLEVLVCMHISGVYTHWNRIAGSWDILSFSFTKQKPSCTPPRKKMHMSIVVHPHQHLLLSDSLICVNPVSIDPWSFAFIHSLVTHTFHLCDSLVFCQAWRMPDE